MKTITIGIHLEKPPFINMKYATLCFITFFIFSFSFITGQSWDWGAAGYGGSLKGSEFGSAVATDKNGNVYITGEYDTKITFGTFTLTGNEDNAFLVKYNSAGTVLWAVEPKDSTGYSVASSVTTDQSGNIYICGYFVDIVKFGTITLNTNGYRSVFLVKYSPSGIVLWAKQSVAPGDYSSEGYSVATDNLNNAFVTGYYEDTISFGTYRLVNLNESAFLVKYDSSGNVLWVNQPDIPSTSCYGYGNSVTTDNMGNTYMAGYFETAIFFGSYELISLNNYSAFLAKYSSGGNLLWAEQSVNLTNINGFGYAYSAITDREDNCYITGYFEDSVQFGSYILNSPSAYSVFLTKYDSTGNVLWANQSSEGWEGTSLSIDSSNHIYLGGLNRISVATLTFGDLTLSAVPWASSNSFLVRFDANGEPACGSILENLGITDETVGIASDSTGNYIYMAGLFEDDTVICGNDTLFSNISYTNIFAGRWLNCAADAGINPITSSYPSVTLFPNPNNGMFTIEIAGTQNFVSSSIEIYNVMGEKIYTATLPQTPKRAFPKGNHSENRINISGQSNGVYLYRVISETGALIGEGKVVTER